ncbi:hypothetical protein [Desulfovibrio ferrophilus]|uniref:Uncharacterized protein n=1 Tax=Desulfovibrio ferrophilus TaxID=241368 RepID=A0A2Z6AWB6_9BACT|nr:hypothetical protein [Desulfovibrio ferrophilus]BBD07510.1 uncharacterized protein DFE_0784 [Desulfovibrio ferrophilus]
MQIHSVASEQPLPSDRAYVMTMTIKSFKGRKNVQVHLFRPEFSEEEFNSYNWDGLLGDPVEPDLTDPEGSKKLMLEAFTKEERDQIFDYIERRYEDRVIEATSAPMSFPIPTGLSPLSAVPEGKTIGLIRFSQLPNFDLPFPMHGLYDLSQAEPLVEEQA